MNRVREDINLLILLHMLLLMYQSFVELIPFLQRLEFNPNQLHPHLSELNKIR